MSLQHDFSERPAMNRHGKKRRKRTTTARTATGRPRPPSVDYRALAAGQPHRRVLPEAYRLDERAGTHLGRLNLIWRISEAKNANKRLPGNYTIGITDAQYQAGIRYAVIVGAYLAMANAPKGTSGSGKGYGCSGDENCPQDTCICRARTERYVRAYEAISDGAGRPAHMALKRVAIHDQPCSAHEIEHLKLGLDILARHFGLTSGGKS